MKVLSSVVAAFVVVAVLGALAGGARKDERSMDANSFTIRFPSGYTRLLAVCLIFFCGFILASNFIFAGQQGVWVLQSVMALFAFGALFGVLYSIRWRIHVNGDTIAIVPLFGKSKTFSVREISRVKFYGSETAPQVKVYDLQGKKLFALESSAAGFTLMAQKLSALPCKQEGEYYNSSAVE